MKQSERHILVNLPAGFFKTPEMKPTFARLTALGEVRQTSYDTPEQISKDLAWADAVLMWSWPRLLAPLLDASPRLKFAGQIDIAQEAARVALDRGLAVSVSRAGFSPSVAEMALTLILACLRKTSDYHAAMRVASETWVKSFPDDIDPLERQLTGGPVAIVGFGRIGRRLAELLKPFNGVIRIVDPFVTETAAAAAGVVKSTLDEAAAQSDVVVLSAATNDNSLHLFGAAQIALLRKNAVLINVARAALVDTQALIARLKKNDLVAAIDVFDAEPLAIDHPLRKLPNVYLTPHRSGGVMESVQRIINWLIDDMELFFAGKPRNYPLVEAMVPSLDR